MKKLLNTLYVTSRDAYLTKDGLNIVVSCQQEEKFRIPVQNVEAVCTFGYHGASPGLMRLCTENNVALSFFSPNGHFIARIQGPVNGNVLLRHKQHLSFGVENPVSLQLGASVIASKIYNSRVTLRRFIRDYPDREGSEEVEKASVALKRYMKLAYHASSLAQLRGIEGEAAACYFEAFPHLILRKEPHFRFTQRKRRPPTDIVNAMLSFGYSILANECASALEGVGLDPAVGFMHAMRPGRHSLALDLMEELRSPIVDRLVISMINNRQISPSDFLLHEREDGRDNLPVTFSEEGRKKFLTAWQNKKKVELIHPFLNEKIQIGHIPHLQAQLLARYLRDDIENYPPYFSK